MTDLEAENEVLRQGWKPNPYRLVSWIYKWDATKTVYAAGRGPDDYMLHVRTTETFDEAEGIRGVAEMNERNKRIALRSVMKGGKYVNI